MFEKSLRVLFLFFEVLFAFSDGRFLIRVRVVKDLDVGEVWSTTVYYLY